MYLYLYLHKLLIKTKKTKMRKKKEYVIESKGYNYVRDSIERRKKELEELKQKIENQK